MLKLILSRHQHPSSGRTHNYDRSDDVWLALLAARYVELSVETTAAVPALAKIFKRKNDTIRDLLRIARRRKLLSDPPAAGRAGGHLLPDAIRLIEEAENS